MPQTVAMTLDPSTHKLALAPGSKFVYGDLHTVTVTLSSGTFDGSLTWKLTMKDEDDCDGSAYVTATATVAATAATRTVSVNLNVDALKTSLDAGSSILKKYLFEFGDTTDTTYGLGNNSVYNRARRPADTAAANPSTNAYTDAEVLALIGDDSTVAVNTTLTYTNGRLNIIYVDTTGGAITITLPDISTITSDGCLIRIVNVGPSAVTVASYSTDPINGNTNNRTIWNQFGGMDFGKSAINSVDTWISHVLMFGG